VLLREPELQRRILGDELGVGPQRISEGEPLVPEVAPGVGQMQSVPRLREVMRDPGPVTNAYVATTEMRTFFSSHA